jgi:hypothetical protein
MAEIAGVSIVEITAFGWSEDGQHIPRRPQSRESR